MRPEYVNEGVFDFCVSSCGSFIFLLVCISQLRYDFFIYLIFYFEFCCYHPEAYSFLMRFRKGVNTDGRGDNGEMGEVEGEDTTLFI